MTPAELKERLTTFAADVIDLCRVIRRDPAGRDVADQLSDAAGSMGANYRAACRARSHKEFTAKIGVSVEEADEAVGWIDLALRARLTSAEDAAALLNEANELLAILATSYRTARRREELARQRSRA